MQIINSNTWNQLTVYEQIRSGSFKKCYLQNIHLKIMCVEKKSGIK